MSLPYGPYLPGTFNCVEVVRRRTLSQVSPQDLFPTAVASDPTPPDRMPLAARLGAHLPPVLRDQTKGPRPAMHGGVLSTDNTICFSDLCRVWRRSSTPVLHSTMQESPRSIPFVSSMLSAWLQIWISQKPTRPRCACGHPTTGLELTSQLHGASALAHTLQTFARYHVLSRDIRVPAVDSAVLHWDVRRLLNWTWPSFLFAPELSHVCQRCCPALLRHAHFWALSFDIHVKS